MKMPFFHSFNKSYHFTSYRYFVNFIDFIVNSWPFASTVVFSELEDLIRVFMLIIILGHL